MADLKNLWRECLVDLKEELREEAFRAWFEPTQLLELDKNDAVLTTRKDDLHANFIEEKYADIVTRVLQKKTGKIYRIKVVSRSPGTRSERMTVSELNESYTFKNFIEGPSNEFAYSASLAVAEAPGTNRFNPLFIYGSTGLGKTHLLHAIGNYAIEQDPKKVVSVKSSVKFIDEYINYIKIKKIELFYKEYQSNDLLLIDDIQLLSGKQETQETFFHIFNDLYQAGKQIVLTSDKHPKDLDGLEDRLVSRFQSGLTVDIQPPNLETKIAIIHKKAEKNKLTLPEDVVEYVAKNSSTNIREMEGYINKLLAYSTMYNVDIDFAKAVQILSFKPQEKSKTIYVEEIIDKVSKFYNLPKEKIIQGTREKENIIPRQIAMYLSRKLTDSSLKSIGKIFTKDHSTIIHGFKTIEKMIKKSEKIKNEIHALTRELV